MSPDARLAVFPGLTVPQLLVVVDTEAEFDWAGPFSSENTSCAALAWLPPFQEMCVRLGIVPTYVCDYPVAAQTGPEDFLVQEAQAGRALVGAHLQSWVTPPFEGEVSRHSSYQCNLPPELEQAKLEQLTALISDRFGTRPLIHKAGRYGLGPHTGAALEALGYQIDLSLCPRFDLSKDGGPDHLATRSDPFWFGPKGSILELPTTAGFSGLIQGIGTPLFRLMELPGLRALPIEGALSKLRLLERARLSREGYRLGEIQRLTRSLIGCGVPVLSFTLHSPTLGPGYTKYTPDEDAVTGFLRDCETYLTWFRDSLGGQFTTPLDVRQSALGA